MIRLILCALILGLSQLSSAAIQLSADQRMADFQEVVDQLEDNYSFLTYKEDIGIIRFDSLVQEYRAQVLAATDYESFKFAMIRFIAEFRDLHMAITEANPKRAQLGFATDWIDGKVVVHSVDEARLPDFPFEKGDEVLSMNGIPVSEIKHQLARYRGTGHNLSREKVSTFFLTERPAAIMPMPAGKTDVTFRTRDGLTKTISMDWLIEDGIDKNVGLAGLHVGLEDQCATFTRLKAPQDATFIPDLDIEAYYYTNEKGQSIGVLKIPHFASLDGGYENLVATFEQYAKAIEVLQAHTDGLIIDQTYNCGGSVSLVLKMVSLFAKEPFTPTLFDFRVSDQQLKDLEGFHPSFQPNSAASARFQSVIDVIKNAMNDRLHTTKPIPFWGFMNYQLELEGTDQVQPYKTQYTKPVVVLINEMSGSGGDMFPALMQDLKLATLVGQKTMGAGGHVWQGPELKYSKLHFAMTKSRIYRTDGSFIENNGVAPDYHYDIRMDDFLNGFQYYREYAEDLLQL